ncbi:MAG: hypothetical protein EXX96DRAFT_538814 [Benjaminiella poitrasii]|nr:MAG: hypothetical protein EXX96DRAFT_538814 [Benjaminiella poitrasii]
MVYAIMQTTLGEKRCLVYVKGDRVIWLKKPNKVTWLLGLYSFVEIWLMTVYTLMKHSIITYQTRMNLSERITSSQFNITTKRNERDVVAIVIIDNKRQKLI